MFGWADAAVRMRSGGHAGNRLADRIVAEQVRAHYAQIPSMTLAPSLGGLYTVWVLWDVADKGWLQGGILLVWLLSGIRLSLYRQFLRQDAAGQQAVRWRVAAVATAAVSGCIWGSAAPLLYPPTVPEYALFLAVLLTLLPIVPVAALADYMPAFHAYFIPCMAPFIFTLALHPGAERWTAVLLVMMMAAMLGFARRYSDNLAEAIRLRLELDERSRALQAAVSARTELIAAASHDLRQPVHAIGLVLEALRHHQMPPEPQRLLSHVDAGVRSLRGMLGNMLDVSRLEADTLAPHLETFSAHELVYSLGDEYAVLALERGLVLRCRATEAWVRSDRVLLERMLRNLLSNALRFTPRGGVVLACRVHRNEVRLQVADTGIGIASTDQRRVFDLFARVEGVAAGDGGGLGLGLAIVQRFSRLLGHTIALRSRLGRGSLFTLTLARAQAPSAAAAFPVTAAADMPPGRVMVIDDDEAVARAAAAILTLWGHQAVVCADVQAALHYLDVGGLPPDLLLADLRLGKGRSGLEAVAVVRRRIGRPLPVVLVTGDTAPMRIREAMAAGYALLHKPVEPQRLRECLAQAWAAGGSGAPVPVGSPISRPTVGD